MSYRTLDIERKDGVATIWMNRPEVFNAFDETLIEELSAACQALNADDSVRVVVLGGKGKHFSAGADLNWMKRASGYTEEENFADATKFAKMLRGLSEMDKPTIARVQGAALGGGTGLTAACDMAVATTDASFSTSEAKFGIIPSVISPYVLRAIGPRQALRYFQSAERFDAQRAYELGLVQEVVVAEQLDEKVAELVAALKTCGPKAQVAAKSLIRAVSNRPIGDEVMQETAKRISAIRATPEAKAGIAAFLDKKPAPWIE
ncbi:MAG TPA: enoyl-CoA hydratase/isomerase family protein [Rhodocyclaceae bacterium]|nr:enoyl-CoA hydratase/isomerase family protein [Rhodocyclaceae bacterium]